jgi:hypothetical protein
MARALETENPAKGGSRNIVIDITRIILNEPHCEELVALEAADRRRVCRQRSLKWKGREEMEINEGGQRRPRDSWGSSSSMNPCEGRGLCPTTLSSPLPLFRAWLGWRRWLIIDQTGAKRAMCSFLADAGMCRTESNDPTAQRGAGINAK